MNRIRVIHDSHDYWGRTRNLRLELDEVLVLTFPNRPDWKGVALGELADAKVPECMTIELDALRRAYNDAKSRADDLRRSTRELWSVS